MKEGRQEGRKGESKERKGGRKKKKLKIVKPLLHAKYKFNTYTYITLF